MTHSATNGMWAQQDRINDQTVCQNVEVCVCVRVWHIMYVPSRIDDLYAVHRVNVSSIKASWVHLHVSGNLSRLFSQMLLLRGEPAGGQAAAVHRRGL